MCFIFPESIIQTARVCFAVSGNTDSLVNGCTLSIQIGLHLIPNPFCLLAAFNLFRVEVNAGQALFMLSYYVLSGTDTQALVWPCVQMWSSSVIKSTIHRVIYNSSSGNSRYSIPFFMHPSQGSSIDCGDKIIDSYRCVLKQGDIMY